MTVPILRTSERADLYVCPQKWWWAWREGLRARGNNTPDALWFGTGVHLALAEWYRGPGAKRGPHPAETWDSWSEEEFRTIKTFNQLDEEEEVRWVDARELGRVMLDEYVKLYGKDEHKLIISPEKTFKLRVPWPADQGLYPEACTREHEGGHDESSCAPLPNDGILFDYCGTFDSVWRHADTGQIWLDEHKTAGTISTGHLTLDPQAGSYWAVAGRTLRQEGRIGPKEHLAGIEYNFLRKALPDERPKDAEGYATNLPQRAHYIDALATWYVTSEDGRALAIPGDITLPDSGKPLSKMKLDELVRLANEHGLTVLGDRSKVQPARNFERVQVHRTRPERNSQLVRLQQDGLLMVAYKDGILPIVKHPGRHCNQGAFRCQFFEMCELHEAGGEEAIEDYKRSAYKAEDPYADHR